jgi:excisionase family DNA binding protein
VFGRCSHAPSWTVRTDDRGVANARRDDPAGGWPSKDMTTNHPLTLTVEQAAQVLGIGRSTAYELVRTGDLKCIHLRRRIVIPVAHLADCLGVEHTTVWAAIGPARPAPLAKTSVVATPLAEAFVSDRSKEPTGRLTLF